MECFLSFDKFIIIDFMYNMLFDDNVIKIEINSKEILEGNKYEK